MKPRILNLCYRVALTVSVCFLAGCYRPGPPLSLNLGERPHVATATLQWRQKKDAKPFHGAVTVRWREDQVLVSVGKGMGINFLELRQTPERWRMHIAPEEMTLGSRGTTAPGQLRIWLEMPRILAELLRPSDSRAAELIPYVNGGRKYELSVSEFAMLGGRRVPSRIRVVDFKTGASLELKFHELR